MMKNQRLLRHLALSILALASIFFSESLHAQGLVLKETPPGVATMFDPVTAGMEQFHRDSTLFYKPFSTFKREVRFDSSQTFVIVEEKLFDRFYSLPVKMDLEDYVARRLKYERQRIWRQVVTTRSQVQLSSGAGGIELNVPVKIRSKLFKTIFGGDRVGLRVSGNISFELAGRTESREGSAVSSIEERGNFSPKFKQTQQFRVEGRVGDKVTVSVDQNSEATFDFENTLKLTYEGDEDEIVQKIEAGNVALSLPSTNYVSTGSNHQGLFGIKTQMQVGNFSFTGIASLERGENETLSVDGGARENTFRIRDYEYLKDRFFFIDDFYQQNFEASLDEENMILRLDTTNFIRQIDVWKTTSAIGNTQFDETFFGYAVNDLDSVANIPNSQLTQSQGQVEVGRFQRLVEGQDYKFDFQRGYFWLTSQVSQNEVIAVAYRNRGGQSFGNLFQDIDSLASDTVRLRLIKAKGQDESFPTWNLSMKNVYNLGASGITADGFDVKVLYSITGEDQEINPTGRSYNNLMGLDRLNEQGIVSTGGDKKIDYENQFIFDLRNGYLIMPSVEPFNPPNKFAFEEDRRVDIYNTTNPTLIQNESKFEIEVTTTSASSTYDLGFNVLEGSEKVTLNGRPLNRDKDYTIDYFTGTLDITAPEARRAEAQVNIEYERAALFQLDKKTLLGGRLEYQFGERNFIGLTGLYYSKSTLDQRVRLGQEPLKNFVWDINTSLNFKPNFLTKIFDALPIVETSAESKLKVEAEYAQVNPNPNTFNENKLGDSDGVAYIDDFEGSRRFTSLGIQYRIWSMASVPAHFFRFTDPRISYGPGPFNPDPINNRDYILAMDKNRMRFNWYNPFDQIRTQSIWPDRDVTAASGTTTTVMTLRWQNNETSQDSAWAGIMRSTASFPDQQKTKFIELWVRGEKGQLNVDLGQISEDYWVRGKTPSLNDPDVLIDSYATLNTEDRNNNGLLDLDDNNYEDTGIDGIRGEDGSNVENDAGDDDWADPRSTSPGFLTINGTERNSDAKGARFPDTEDLDGDGVVNLFNNYFSYTINLDTTLDKRYLASRTEFDDGSPTGWKLYRIPIRQYEFVIGDPDTTFQRVFSVRLWVNDIAPTVSNNFDSVQIATFDFVGNDWEEIGFKDRNETQFEIDEEKFGITVYNTEEHSGEPTFYRSPPGVEGIKDRITNAISKEQSLVLQLRDLPVGARVEAKKQFREKINLINYKRLKMFVHGDERLDNNDLAPRDSLIFYMRFGPTDKIYYEYRQALYPGWDVEFRRNDILIDFEELARTKDFPLSPDSLAIVFGRNDIPDTSTADIFYRPDPGFPGKEFIVVGNPGLHNINYFTIGVINAGQDDLEDYEVWLDEMRVTGVERESGTAMRLLTDLTVADIGSIRAQWELIDDDFRRVEQQFASPNGKDQTQEKQSYFAQLKLHKFMPESWGFEIPIDAKLTRNRSVPKYFFNSDQRTNYDVGGFGNRLKTFLGMSEVPERLQKDITFSENRSVGATLKRRKKTRDPWFLKYTFNEMVFDVDYSEKQAFNPNNAVDNSTALSGRFSYQIPFGRENSFRPFGWMGKSKIFSPLTGINLFYTPSSASFNFNLTDNEDIRQSRIEQELGDDPITNVNVRNTRKYSLGYKLTDNITFDYNRDYQSDARLDSTKDLRASDLLQQIVREGDFGTDTRITQRFSAAYNPRLFSWLSGSYRYAANFIYSLDRPQIQAKSSNLTVNHNVNVDFKFGQLLERIWNPKKAPTRQRASNTQRGRRGGRNSRGQNQQSDTEDDDDDDDDDDKEESKGPSIKPPNPIKLMWSFLTALRTISVDYREDANYNDFNLTDVPGWRYQFGLESEDPTNGMPDTTFNKVIVARGIRNTKTIDGSTQIDLFNSLKTSFKYNRQEVTNFSSDQETETTSNTVFFTGNDPGGLDSTGASSKTSWWDLIPDWRVNLTGVEKLPLFKAFARTATVEHARNGKFSETIRQGQLDQASYTMNWQPFIGLTVNTIWNVTASLRSNRSVSIDYRTAGATTRREQSGTNISASYSVTRGFRLPLPFLKNKKLNNEIQFSLAFDQSRSANYSKSITDDDFQELDISDSWKLRPAVTYRFSQKVNGTAFYEQSRSSNKRTGTTTYKEFGINVNIAIR